MAYLKTFECRGTSHTNVRPMAVLFFYIKGSGDKEGRTAIVERTGRFEYKCVGHQRAVVNLTPNDLRISDFFIQFSTFSERLNSP